jgi:hypothetical protein
MRRSSVVVAGGRANRGGSMAPPSASQGTQRHQETRCSYIRLKERSTSAAGATDLTTKAAEELAALLLRAVRELGG